MDEILAETTLLDLLAMHARERPSAQAIVDADGRVLSYAGLYREVVRVGEMFAGMAIDRGSRVATALRNGSEAPVAMLATMSCATCVPLDPSLEPAACRSLLAALKVDALIVPADEELPAAAAARALGVPVWRLQSPPADKGGPWQLRIDGMSRPGRADPPAATDLALVLHSSGTTAQPKVVPLTQAQLIARARVSPIARDDHGLCAVPVFTASAIEANLVATIVVGAGVTFLRAFDVAGIVDALHRLQPTYLWAGPAVLASLRDTVAGRPGALPRSVRLIRTAGAPLSPQLQTALEANLGVPVMQGYGMTETGAIARNLLPPAPRPPGSVGKPLGPGVAILGPGDAIGCWREIGEVVVRGPGVMTGYENSDDANRQAFHEGWFRTGDLGRFDADGYLYLTGRLHELINRGGHKVSPAEVDAAMLQHPAVAEAAAFAMPHPSLGEDVHVAVVLRPHDVSTAQELRRHAMRHLAPFKVPTGVVIVDALERNSGGKVNRSALAESLRDALGQPFQEPRNPDEARIAGIFASVLKLPIVGTHDDFFHLGGDSLRGMQVIARVNSAYRIDLRVSSLFESPTVALLAEAVQAAAPADQRRETLGRRGRR